MGRILVGIFVWVIISGCQKEQVSSDTLPTEQFEKIEDYIIIFKESRFAGMNSLVNENNYEQSFDVFQYEYNKILAQADVKPEQTTQTYIKVFNGCAVSMKRGDYLKLLANVNVNSIVKDSTLKLLSSGFMGSCAIEGIETVPCGVGMLGAGRPYTGSNRVFILDTGVERDHPDLILSKNMQFSAYKHRNDNKAIDRFGHGTHVAGIIGAIANNGIGVVGVAPGVEIVPVKVIDDNGTGTISSILAGIDYVKVKANPGDVVNMSIGGGAINILDNAVYDISQKGIWFTIAAGNNSGDAAFVSPARTNGKYICTVAAMTCEGTFAFFSNYGEGVVDYVAPGVNICSTSLNGGYASLSGTSMAAPHAAGVILMTNGKPNSCGNVMCEKDNVYYKAICL